MSVVTIRYVRGEPVIKTSIDIPYAIWLKIDGVAKHRKGEYIVKCLEHAVKGIVLGDDGEKELTRAVTRDGTVAPTTPCGWDVVKGDVLKELPWICDAMPHVGVTPQMVDAVLKWGVEKGYGLDLEEVKGGLERWSRSTRTD